MIITSVSAQEVSIPAWIKNNAGWWADGQIDDKTFVKGIEYLVKVGIIIIEQIDETEQVLFYSIMEESGIKITYAEKMKEYSGDEFVIIDYKLENNTGDKIQFILTKLSEHLLMTDEEGQKYLLIHGLLKNESDNIITVSLHVSENKNGRQIIYIEHNNDNEIFRKLTEPKHFWSDNGAIGITKFKFLLKEDLSERYEKWWTIPTLFTEIDTLREKYTNENDQKKLELLDEFNNYAMSIQKKI